MSGDLRVELRFSPDDTVASIGALLRELDPVLHRRQPNTWTIDLTRCKYLGPFAAAFLGALWHREKARGGNPIMELPAHPPELEAFCRYVGLR